MSEQLGFDFDESPPSAARESRLMAELRQVTGAHPLERKILIAPTRGQGRELLRQLALTGTAWIGWEATTIRPLAVEIAGTGLARQGLQVLDDFEFTRLVDAAIDEVLVGRRAGVFTELAESLGFRRAVRDAVTALRMAGVDSAVVRETFFQNRAKRRVLAQVLSAYDAARADGGFADTAQVLELALKELEDGADVEGLLVVVPGMSLRGLSGRVLRSLIERHHALSVAVDPVVGLPTPEGMHWIAGPPASPGSFLHEPAGLPRDGIDVQVFAGTTVSEEIREVLRRVLEAGHAWDQVEIVTPDPLAYGSALHQLAERLGLPVTYGVGLPVARTRPGRVVTEFFRWIDTGFSADVIRGLLEAGDLSPPGSAQTPSPMELERRFRNLRIGWGRARYLRRMDRSLAALDGLEPGRYESLAEMEARRERMRSELTALRAILAPALDALPSGIPDPAAGPASAPVTAADVALGLERFLDCVDARDATDETALLRIRQVLERVIATLDRPSEYRAAAATVRNALEVRLPSPREEGRAPWTTRPGHLHLTDIEHGGWTGRPVTYVVGMDSGRFPAGGRQDPLLLDGERGSLAKDALPTAKQRLDEATFTFAALLARLRGSVTISYATWEPTEAREQAPATEVLRAYRLASGDPEALFADLERGLGRPAGVVPRGATRLDAQDVWMAELLGHRPSPDGRGAVAAVFPEHTRGSLAAEAHLQPQPSRWTGRLQPRPMLDPRVDPNQILSATALEALGTCPRKYLFRDVLRVRPPDDPVFDPDRWLSPLNRGGLLHKVYERTLRRCREKGIEPESDAFAEEALSVLSRETALARDIHPTPSAEVQEREMEALADDVRSFVTLVRTRGAPWLVLERKFGFDDVPPVEVRLRDGSIRLRGAIDRIDEIEAGLLVIDYKTGSAFAAEGDTGTFHGGRRLQNVLYTMVARELEDRAVARMEYHYPTRKARNAVLGFTPNQLVNGPFLVERMLDGVGAGAFPATDDRRDCRWCDYRDLCRVRGEGERPQSPYAEWTERTLSADGAVPDLLTALRDVRREEGRGLVIPLEDLREAT